MPLVRVHATKEGGFRRAGRTWPTAPPVIIDVTEEELAVLRAEPMLDVRPARPGEEVTPAEQSPVAGQSAPRDELEQALAGAVAKIEQLEATCDDLRKGSAAVAGQLSAARKAIASLEADLAAATAPTPIAIVETPAKNKSK